MALSLLRLLIFSQTMFQIARIYCQSEGVGPETRTWDKFDIVDNPTFIQNDGQNIDLKNGIEEEDFGIDENNEHDSFPEFNSELLQMYSNNNRDYIKKNAKERRENGKLRKMVKQRKLTSNQWPQNYLEAHSQSKERRINDAISGIDDPASKNPLWSQSKDDNHNSKPSNTEFRNKLLEDTVKNNFDNPETDEDDQISNEEVKKKTLGLFKNKINQKGFPAAIKNESLIHDYGDLNEGLDQETENKHLKKKNKHITLNKSNEKSRVNLPGTKNKATENNKHREENPVEDFMSNPKNKHNDRVIKITPEKEKLQSYDSQHTHENTSLNDKASNIVTINENHSKYHKESSNNTRNKDKSHSRTHENKDGIEMHNSNVKAHESNHNILNRTHKGKLKNKESMVAPPLNVKVPSENKILPKHIIPEGNPNHYTNTKQKTDTNKKNHIRRRNNKSTSKLEEKSESNVKTVDGKMSDEGKNKRNERDIKSNNHKRMPYKNNNKYRTASTSIERVGSVMNVDDPGEKVEDSDYLYDEGSFGMNKERRYFPPKYAPAHNINDDELSKDQINFKTQSKKLYARRAHDQRNNDELNGNDTCVEYKAKSLISSATEYPTSLTERISTTSGSKKDSMKTTRKVNHKSQTTKKVSGDGLESQDNEYLDEYDEFLCGLLADNFVNAVLAKVQRSRKISKELGFSNDTDETCDRCIELKVSGIPDLDSMRDSLGKCSKNSDNGHNTSKCYKVQNSMSDFLDLLLLFEVEHENNAYNNIQDDSSFIFTGDYSESFLRNDDSMKSNYKYAEDSFSKDTFEKQHLRDEITEEKNDDHVSNGHLLEDPRNISPTKNRANIKDYAKSDLEENEDEEIKTVTKAHVNSEEKGHETMKEHSENLNNFQSEANFRSSELDDLFEKQDMMSPIRRKYSANKKQEKKEFGVLGDKPKENVNTRENIVSTKDTLNSHRDEVYKHGTIQQDELVEYPAKNQPQLNKHAKSYGDGQPESIFSKNVEHQPRDVEFSKKYKKFIPRQTKGGYKYDRKNKNFHYFPSELDQFSPNENGQFLRYGDFNGKDWDESEYQLYPSLTKSAMGDNGLRMVKRDAEPSYDDDLLFFEIPDIEYDLY